LAGCGSRYDRALATEPDLVRGQILYESDCAPCHGVDGEGGPGGTSLRETLAGVSGTEIMQIVDDGLGQMPGFRDEYTIQDLADLHGYVTLEFR
jgi:mono/diheme cytochrome c family protein